MVMKVPVRPTPALGGGRREDEVITRSLFWSGVSGFLPAVHYHGSSLLRVVFLHPLPEAEQVGGILGHPVVRPHQEVELPHFPHWHGHSALPCELQAEREMSIHALAI